jgi:hypothetical protein
MAILLCGSSDPQFIEAEEERPHNVIVPVNPDTPVRNYNKCTALS